MAQGVFTTLYRKLNTEQKRAVDTIEGPVMVIAGPGTGKTQILTLRIANILQKTDTPPEAILALTFTEPAAATCRRRLVDIVGTSGYRVQIHTFHSYANDVIRRFPDSFPRIIGSRALSTVERIALLQRLIDTTPLTVLRPFGNVYFYVSSIAQRISELKREHVTPDDFTALLKKNTKIFRSIPDLYHTKGTYKGMMRGKYLQMQKRFERDRELLKVYQAYETLLAKEHLYDYEDMLLEVIRALRYDQDLLLTLQEEAQYVLADEHQDVNESQNQLLELLISFHKNPNIFVVGDEKQAIFRFQGASLDNFLFFKKRFPAAVLITLRTNYRSTQTILNAAHALISHTEKKEGPYKTLTSRTDTSMTEKVAVYTCERPYDECWFVAKEIKQRIEEGIDPRNIAIIYRMNRDAESMLSALFAEGVPAQITSEQNALADLAIQKFITILNSIVFYGSDAALVPVLHIDFLNLDPLVVAQFLAKRKQGFFSALANKKILQDMGIPPEPFLLLAKKMHRWKRLVHNEGVLATLDAVAEESGLLAHILACAYPEEKIAHLRAFYAEAAAVCHNNRHTTLHSFLQHIHLLEEYHLPLSIPMVTGNRNAVQLMTAHRSKGQEFSEVYILHANDGYWGNRQERSFFSPFQLTFSSDTDDERRLFYVALTRGKSRVVITYARENENGSQLLPTQFIQEMQEQIVEYPASPADTYPVSVKKDTFSYLDRDFVTELFFQQGLSATALNNYLECPWRYFYRNLLRVPEAPEKELEYGTAIHTALRDFFERWKEGENPTLAGLLRFFVRAMRQASVPAEVLPSMVEKGKKALRSYYREGHLRWDRAILNEYNITVLIPLSQPTFSHLRLRGYIDKLSFDQDGKICIHDYKTGKPKTKGQVIGKETVALWGPYKRQLVFYKLLADHHVSTNISLQNIEKGMIEFIEPDERNRIISIEVPLTKEDTQALLETLIQITDEIISFSFTQKGCGKKECHYCKLRAYVTPTNE